MIVCFTLAFLTNDYLEDAEIAHGHMGERDFGDAQSEALEALADLFGLPVKIVGNDSTGDLLCEITPASRNARSEIESVIGARLSTVPDFAIEVSTGEPYFVATGFYYKNILP